MKRTALYIYVFLQLFIFKLSSITAEKFNLDTRIVGGEDTDIRNHSYQVSLQLFDVHFCGGALIDNDTVITAAHCFGQSYSSISSYYTVKYGSNTTSEGLSAEIQSVLIHPNYNETTINNDIAIIKLKTNVTLSENVSLIRLSESDNYTTESLATVTGWGYTAENGQVSATLQKVDVPITSHESCQQYYSAMINITEMMLCAGFPEGGRDACQGDSGGPLVQSNQLIGIVSFGLGCARPNYPGVYTNVAQLVDWVAANSNYTKSLANSFTINKMSYFVLFTLVFTVPQVFLKR